MVKMALRFVVLFLRVDSSTDKLARLKKGAWLDLKGNEKNVWNNFFFPTVNLLLLHVNTYCQRFVEMLCCSWTDSRPHWRVPWPLCSQAPSRQRRAFFLQMRKILYSMEFENLKRLLGWEFRCAGRNKILSFEDNLKEVRYKTVDGLSFECAL